MEILPMCQTFVGQNGSYVHCSIQKHEWKIWLQIDSFVTNEMLKNSALKTSIVFTWVFVILYFKINILFFYLKIGKINSFETLWSTMEAHINLTLACTCLSLLLSLFLFLFLLWHFLKQTNKQHNKKSKNLKNTTLFPIKGENIKREITDACTLVE